MAETFHFELVTPDRLLMAAEPHRVTVPGAEGDYGVMAAHAPVVSTMRPGVLEVLEEEGGAPVRIFIRGGFAEMDGTRLTVLAEQAIPLEELNREALEQHIKDVREDIEDAEDDAVRDRLTRELLKLEELLSALD